MGYVVVTGSQAGPGLAIRKQLEASGRIVLGIDLPGKGAEVEADLSTPDGRQEAIQNLLKQCGGVLDGLVCNVGVDHAPDSLVISLNYFGTVDLLVGLRDALAWGKQPAAVTNVSNSMLITPGIPEDMVEALLQGDEGRALELLKDHPGKAYASSNLALARWIRRHAPSPQWAGRGITLNGVSPGPIVTDPWQQALDNPLAGWWALWSSMWAPDLLRQFLGDPAFGNVVRELPRPMGRHTTPEQVANLFEFLLSDKARFIVGQVIAIDGGIEATFRPDDWPAALPSKPARESSTPRSG